ncbi:hypothetical protein [Natranaerofaba carboxydovora]|uniref:hypothetical protein n=1 Tax=Natranaerofaba carboxydovora TaxID=2742683 RepID=UPI001F136939|nr:hypothetical protein [Natranaerofaba carboxydovora]UMZ74983.1 hypothetical protein ACONDI_02589 [Natranaerofaba carboxydovora]
MNKLNSKRIQGDVDFSEEILKELVEKGYSGKQLIDEFKKMKAKVRPAVNNIIEEAERKAKEYEGTGDEEMKDIFEDIEKI